MSGDVKGVYIIRDVRGVPVKACIDEGYARGNMAGLDTIERHELLTPEMAAVVEAAKAWAYSDGSEFGLDECEKLLSAVNTLRAQEGE